MIHQNNFTYLLLATLWIVPVMAMDSQQAIIQSGNNINLAFSTWSTSQGAFKKVGLPKELRYKIVENASREYVNSCEKFVKKIFMFSLSVQDILFCSKGCLDGIQILNDAKASKRYDLRCNITKTSFTISQHNYKETLDVPFFIKMKTLQGNEKESIPAYNNIYARVIIYPDLIECGSMAYQELCLAGYPACSYFDK